MRLFHFTSIVACDAIMSEGLLKPSDNPRDGLSRYWPHGCVWFTRIFRDPSWWGDPERFQRCLEVTLPSTDKHLMSSARWLRSNFDADMVGDMVSALNENDRAWGTHWRDSWVYFGTVPASRIKKVIHVNVVVDADTSGGEIEEESRWYRQ
jgi:hypothetical protein